MKIAIVAPFPDFSRSFSGGSLGATIRYMREESAYKDSIRIFTLHQEDPYPELDLDMLPPSLEEDDLIPSLAERLRRFAPDIIEVHNKERMARALSKRCFFTPVILISHSFPPARKRSLWNRLINPLWLKRFIGVSDAVRDAYRANYPEYQKRMMTIRNAMPFEKWQGDVQSKEKLILFAARAGAHKGLGEYVEALAECLPRLPDWQAAVLTVEDEHSDPSLRKLLQKRYGAALGERCQWVQNAPYDEVALWMKRAAIFVAPSNWEEPFGMALLEAHLGGAAVVSSGRGGMPEISGAEGALTLPEVSGKAIADAITKLANNDEARLALAKRGQDYVLKHHRIEDRAAELDALRRKLTGKS